MHLRVLNPHVRSALAGYVGATLNVQAAPMSSIASVSTVVGGVSCSATLVRLRTCPDLNRLQACSQSKTSACSSGASLPGLSCYIHSCSVSWLVIMMMLRCSARPSLACCVRSWLIMWCRAR